MQGHRPLGLLLTSASDPGKKYTVWSKPPNSSASSKVFQGSLCDLSAVSCHIAEVQGIPNRPGKTLTPTLSGTYTLPVWGDIKLIPLFIEKSPLTQFALTLKLLPAILALSINNFFYATETSNGDSLTTAWLWVRRISCYSEILCDIVETSVLGRDQ